MIMKKYWSYIVGAVGFILGLFLLSKKKDNKLEIENAVLEFKQKENETSIAEEKAKMEAIKKPVPTELKSEEVESFWKDKK